MLWIISYKYVWKQEKKEGKNRPQEIIIENYVFHSIYKLLSKNVCLLSNYIAYTWCELVFHTQKKVVRLKREWK